MSFKRGRCLLKKRLKEIRRSQDWLADKMNRSKQQISDYANDRVAMSIETAKNASHAIGCHIDDLYDWFEVPDNRKSRREE